MTRVVHSHKRENTISQHDGQKTHQLPNLNLFRKFKKLAHDFSLQQILLYQKICLNGRLKTEFTRFPISPQAQPIFSAYDDVSIVLLGCVLQDS